MNMLHWSVTEYQLVIQTILLTLAATFSMVWYLGQYSGESQEIRSLLSLESRVLVRLIFVLALSSISLSLAAIVVSYTLNQNLL